jgi:hypothetical protein
VGFPLRAGYIPTPTRTFKQLGKLNPQSDWDSNHELGLEQGYRPCSGNTANRLIVVVWDDRLWLTVVKYYYSKYCRRQKQVATVNGGDGDDMTAIQRAVVESVRLHGVAVELTHSCGS